MASPRCSARTGAGLPLRRHSLRLRLKARLPPGDGRSSAAATGGRGCFRRLSEGSGETLWITKNPGNAGPTPKSSTMKRRCKRHWRGCGGDHPSPGRQVSAGPVRDDRCRVLRPVDDPPGFPMDFDYLHATRYGPETQGGKISWRTAPWTSVGGRSVSSSTIS